MLSGLALAALLLQAAEPTAWLGVRTAAHTSEIEVGERAFHQGIRIVDVLVDSPAEAAGLHVDDIIVAIDGAEFDCPADELPDRFGAAIRSHKVGDTVELLVFRNGVERRARLDDESISEPAAWKDPEEFVRPRPPGAKLELIVERVRGLHALTATLAARPADVFASRALPPNERIFERPVEHLVEERLVEALIREFGVKEAYHDQRARLAALVERGDPYRLSRFAYALREPFAMATLSRRLADVPDELPALLTHAATWLDHPPEITTAPPLRTGLSPKEHARQIEAVLTAAHTLHEQAFAGLNDEERKFVEQHLGDLCDALLDDIMILRGPDRRRASRITRLVELAAKVDTAKLVAAAIRLSPLLEPDYLEGLRDDLASGGGIFLEHDTPHGKIVFAGTGRTWFQKPAAVIIDLGGDDFYTQPTQRPFSVVIDLGGDDAYQATSAQAHGCGFLGVALLYDHSGDDRYVARRWALGAGVVGVGVLCDRTGNDTYRGADYSQGAAFRGVGLLVDGEGEDRYEAPRFAQGLGLPGGFGALIDRGAGNDHYYCKGRDLGAYGTPGIFAGWGQGCAVGLRGLASGGIALLLDEGGDDVYEGGNFSQGGGYFFGWGVLVDRAGSDRYLGERYAQAFAAHQALGFLEDHAGDDVYLARRGVGQSCSWDQTVTVLLDHAGDDVYSGGGFALAATAHNGLAILVDYAGRDHYQQHSGKARAGGNDYHGGTSLSLLLDLGGAADVYTGEGKNGVVRRGGEHGFFADLPADLPEALRTFTDFIEP